MKWSFASWSLVFRAVLPALILCGLPVTVPAAADLNRQILDEVRALSSRVSSLETQVATVNAEARQAKAEAAQARREAETAKAELAAIKNSSSSTAGTGAVARASSGGNGSADLDALDAQYLGAGAGSGGVAGAAIDGWWTRTSLGGYGEHHLNLGDVTQNDFHRWVLFINHAFNESTRLVSELELEHGVAGEGKRGEIELEQAYIEHDFDDRNSGKAGVILVPVGILNEVHEPTTFFGVERNPIEREILPTTWWEGGAAFTHRTEKGLQADAMVHSGLKVPTTGAGAFRIRNGRQKVSEADSHGVAATTRVRYTGIPGLEIAGSAQFQGDITQDLPGSNNAWLGEGHVDYRRGGFGLRALAAAWHIGGAGAEARDLSDQWGAYIEPSYRFALPIGGELGVFTRVNQFDAAVGEFRQFDLGLNYWPIDNIVFKLDFSHIDALSGGREEDLINLGFGYVF